MTEVQFKGILALLFLTTACSSLDLRRHPRSGYAEGPGYNATEEFYSDQQRHREKQSAHSLGPGAHADPGPESRQKILERAELQRLEGRLASSIEKKQYYTYKPFLPSDRARIYFLTIPSLEARERWVKSQGYNGEAEVFPEHIQSMIESSDIAPGMSRKAVLESWGDPDLKESAGNPLYGNERWIYTKMVSSGDGYEKESRAVYFESGRVVGWEKIKN